MNRGFTLIELLVVIAIIGVLSSIVLTSLSNSRAKGADAAIKTALVNIRSVAEIYYGDNNGYGTQAQSTTCSASTLTGLLGNASVQTYIDDAFAKSGADGRCQSNGSGFVVAMPLESNNANAWCVDSDNRSVQITLASLSSGMDCSLVASSL